MAELETITELKNKVFPLNAPEGTDAPYLVYISSEGQYDKSLDGFLDTKELGCELNILNVGYKNLKNLSKKVMDKLKSFEGRNIGTDGMYIQELTFDDDSPELYEDQVQFYRKIINFKISFREG